MTRLHPTGASVAEPNGTPLAVLQIEDSLADAELIVGALERAGFDVKAARVESAAAMRAALSSQSFDLVISDYRLPQFDAPAALKVLHDSGADIPFIVVSDTIGEDVAVMMMRAGAHDYLLKDNLHASAASRVARDGRGTSPTRPPQCRIGAA